MLFMSVIVVDVVFPRVSVSVCMCATPPATPNANAKYRTVLQSTVSTCQCRIQYRTYPGPLSGLGAGPPLKARRLVRPRRPAVAHPLLPRQPRLRLHGVEDVVHVGLRHLATQAVGACSEPLRRQRGRAPERRREWGEGEAAGPLVRVAHGAPCRPRPSHRPPSAPARRAARRRGGSGKGCRQPHPHQPPPSTAPARR